MENDKTNEIQPPVTNIVMRVPFPDTFVYSSATAYSLTMMDLKIGFGEAMPNRTVEARIGVTLPIEHAAHVCLSLIAQLGAYEENFGIIRHAGWQNLKSQLQDAAGTFLPSPDAIYRVSPEQSPEDSDQSPAASEPSA